MQNERDLKPKINVNGHKSSEVLPGQIEIEIPGLGASDKISDGIKRGKISSLVHNLHEKEKHIVAIKKPGKVVLYVASSLALIGTVAGGVYLSRKKKHG